MPTSMDEIYNTLNALENDEWNDLKRRVAEQTDNPADSGGKLIRVVLNEVENLLGEDHRPMTTRPQLERD